MKRKSLYNIRYTTFAIQVDPHLIMPGIKRIYILLVLLRLLFVLFDVIQLKTTCYALDGPLYLMIYYSASLST